MSAVIVKCNKCGNDRESYNDPRKSKSVIECKAHCHESHYEWTYVSGGDDTDTAAKEEGEGKEKEDYRKVANALYIPPGTKLNSSDSADGARASLEKDQADKKRHEEEDERRRAKEQEATAGKEKKVDGEEKKDCPCTIM
eukprot:GFYU01038010.1.p1 GENE.GFYU01038010.1~~GFYU01038010.1.p1  ORF type:complete len:140 (+),score=36.05 GFYU01038010.1:57-476(+)